ncbi:hypothetical protein SVIOM74S_10543 [Streptomyces violarus]
MTVLVWVERTRVNAGRQSNPGRGEHNERASVWSSRLGSRRQIDRARTSRPRWFGAAWGDGAASAVDARLALRAFLAHGPNAAPAAIPASLAVDAELVVSELITNVIRHAPGPCELILRLFRGQLAITVRDTWASSPVHQGDRFRVGGHGLRLVHTVSERVAVARRSGASRSPPICGWPRTSTRAPVRVPAPGGPGPCWQPADSGSGTQPTVSVRGGRAP